MKLFTILALSFVAHAGCSDPPPPVDVGTGTLTAKLYADPAQIVLYVAGQETWKTEAGGGDGDGKPPHGFAALSTKSYAIQQQFGSYRFDENADQTIWQGISRLGDIAPTATGATFTLLADDRAVGTGTLVLDGDQHATITLAADSGDSVSLASPLDDVEHLVGLGGQSFEVDHRGQHVPLWVQEDGIGKFPDADDDYQGVWFLTGRRHSTHTPMPMLLSSRGYALAVDTTARSVFDLGAEKADSARYEAWDRTLALHLWFGGSPRAALGNMLAWVGKPDHPPPAVFAPWVDAIFGSASVRQVAQALRANGIASSVIWTEDWRGGGDGATGYALKENWRVDRSLYPDIEALASDLHAEGFQFLVYFNTFLDATADVYGEAVAGGYPIRDATGASYDFTGVAFGPSTLLDLTRPESVAWGKGVMTEALNLGADGWMADFGEWLPTDAVLASGDNALAVHNRYPVDWARFSHELLGQPLPGRMPPLYFMRSAWLHAQPYVQVLWPGDQQTDWSDGDGLPSVVPMGIGLGLAGFPYFGGDIGGYMSQGTVPTTEELWYRWVTLGAFEPVMRTHHGRSARDNFQWQHDANSIAHFRRWTRFHQQLAAYLEGSIASFDRDGAPLLRLIALDFPAEDWAWSVMDEYLLGDRILVAPVQTQGATGRDVQLPAGDWVPLLGGAHASGTVSAPAEITEIPAFVPAGSLLVLYPDGIDSVFAGTGVTQPGVARTAWLYPGAAADPARAAWHDVAGPTSAAPQWQWAERPLDAGLPPSATFTPAGGAAAPVTLTQAAADYVECDVTGDGTLEVAGGGTLVIARGETSVHTIVRIYR